MTLSVPSFLAAATRAFMPPPAEAEACVAQLVTPPEPPEEPEDEQPAASSAAAATPASASRCEDLTSASRKLPYPEVDEGSTERPGRKALSKSAAALPKRFALIPLPQLIAQD